SSPHGSGFIPNARHDRGPRREPGGGLRRWEAVPRDTAGACHESPAPGGGAEPEPSRMRVMHASDEPRVALLWYGYWGPNLARNLHLRLGKGWVACVDPDPARRAEGGPRYPWVRAPRDPRHR